MKILEFFERKKILMVGIGVIMAFVFFISQVFAWFTINNTNKINQFNLMSISDIGGGAFGMAIGGQGDSMQYSILPGNYVHFELLLTNNKAEDVTANLVFNLIQVQFPYTEVGGYYQFRDSFIYTNDYYYKNTNNYFDETVITNATAQAFMQSFVSPVTDAIWYDIYLTNHADFVNGYTTNPKCLTNSANADADDNYNAMSLEVEGYQTINKQPTEMLINDDEDVNNIISNANEITIGAGETLTLYMVFYFNPNHVSYGTYDGSQVELRNCNPFIGQDFKLQLTTVSV